MHVPRYRRQIQGILNIHTNVLVGEVLCFRPLVNFVLALLNIVQ